MSLAEKMEEAIYSPLFFPSSREKETFLASFVRIALSNDKGEQDIKEEQANIKPHLDLISTIPNFETLNAQIMWIAVSAYSQLGDTLEEKKKNFSNSMKLQMIIKGSYISGMIRNIFPYRKTQEKGNEAALMYEKITREVYLYLYVLLHL